MLGESRITLDLQIAFSDRPILTADFDEDGDVDATDLGIWKVGFGTTSGAGHTQGDANGDHKVDGADFLLWQRGAGGHVPIVLAGGAVPEPASLALLLIAAAAALRPSRRAGTGTNPCLAGRS